MEEIRQEILRIVGEIFGAAEDLTPKGTTEPEVEITVAPEGVEADFSSNIAMQLTRILHRAPAEIAKEIIKKFTLPGVKVEMAGPGFLNFISSDEYYKQFLANLTDNFAENISCDAYSGKTIICEFSDPNPFKVLHVGHLYTSIVGDAISRLLEFAGAKVVRANFGGDVGLHVAKTLWAVLKRGEKLEGDAAEQAEILAQCYVEGTRAYDEDEVAKTEIVRLNKEIYRIAAENERDGELAETYWRGREASYEYFKEFYARLGLVFDKYYPESSVASRGLKEVTEHTDVYEESEGALVFRGEKYGLHTRVFVNKEGLPTYEAKDVGLLFTKWDDYHFDKSVVITANEIIDYMKVVLKSVAMYAPELQERTVHLTHGMVKLPGAEKMSSRKGNFLRAVDVLDTVKQALPERTDEKVALGATKYALLKYKMGGDIEFDVKSSVSTTGNSGVYLQYACVRAKKILGAVKESEAKEWTLTKHEKNLIKKLMQYKTVTLEAVKEMAPHKVCQYLYELAQEFSRFYENVKVVGSENERERGELTAVYLKTLEHGLSLLGIEAPEEM